MNTLEEYQNHIMRLCKKQGIEPAVSSTALVGPKTQETLTYQDKGLHWAEDIFSRPLSSRTPLKHLRFSECFGPWSEVEIKQARILFQRSFDRDRLTIFAFIDPTNRSPYMVIRSLDTGSNVPLYSTRGVHELCIERDGNCLVIKRWSFSERCAKMWALLYFLTWEGKLLSTNSCRLLRLLSTFDVQTRQ